MLVLSPLASILFLCSLIVSDRKIVWFCFKDKKTEDMMEIEKKDDNKQSQEKEKETSKEKKPEPLFEILENPARVTRAQLKYITFDVDPRYVPITPQVRKSDQHLRGSFFRLYHNARNDV
jgi:hypothetical protein